MPQFMLSAIVRGLVLVIAFAIPFRAVAQEPASSGVVSTQKEPKQGDEWDALLSAEAPPSELVATELIRQIRAKIDDLAMQVSRAAEKADSVAENLAKTQEGARKAVPLPGRLEEALNSIRNADCPGQEAVKPEQKKALEDALKDLGELSQAAFWSFSFQGVPPPWNVDGECNAVKAWVVSQQSRVVNEAKAAVSRFQQQEKSLLREQEQYARNRALLEKLRVRLKELLEASAAGASNNVISKLPVLIAFLGIFSLSIMVMVRRFSTDIQREWVQSGQVIQFMTVTVIVIAVLSLGLAQKLSPENLGTLLGTIGGYVLAQGIGKNGSKQSAAPAGPSTSPASARARTPAVQPDESDLSSTT